MSESTIFTQHLDEILYIFVRISYKIYTFGQKSENEAMENLIGRKKECSELRWAMQSERSEFIILYGRRRIGKTFLVRSFFNDTYSFHFVGAHKQSQRAQLRNFRESLVRYSINNNLPEINTWHEAFLLLQNYLEQLTEVRKVIFFDEMPWMDTQGSDFVSELEYFWANWVQQRDDIVFIACGSATTWMRERLEENQGGLHNRITHRIYLRPFYLNECRQYLAEHGFQWDNYQIMQCYMVFGGVPYYLSLLRPYLSLSENIDALFFHIGADLSNEFSELYNALFRAADKYITIVKLLSTKREGFTRQDIERATNFSGGGLTKILDNLIMCDFVVAYNQFGNKKKDTLYRLCDFYTIFYFKYIDGNKSRDEQYWQHHFADRSVEAWEGFSFEELCIRHLPHIKKGLGISGIATEASAWRFVPKKGDNRQGAQIDLIIKRADKIIHLCEMKFSSKTYTISKDYENKLINRKNTFADITNQNRGVVLTFITPFGLTEGAHTSNIHSSLTANDLFADISD